MIEQEALISNAVILSEALMKIANPDTDEDCCKVMQVLLEVALTSVARNADLGRAVFMVQEVLPEIAKAVGGEAHVELREEAAINRSRA